MKSLSFQRCPIWKQAQELVLYLYDLEEAFEIQEQDLLHQQLKEAAYAFLMQLSHAAIAEGHPSQQRAYEASLTHLGVFHSFISISKNLQQFSEEVYEVIAEETISLEQQLLSMLKCTIGR